jgi:hypothetical protein
MSGKGDRPRPVNYKKYSENYKYIFDKMRYYYEVQQKNGSDWRDVGSFLYKKNAEKYEKEFNTKIMINPTRIVKRKFLDLMYEKK